MNNRVKLHDKEFTCFLSQEDIDAKIRDLAREINKAYTDKNPLALCILSGSFIFAADLVRYLSFPLPMEFVRYASYEGTGSTGKVKKIFGIKTPVEGRDILIIEDIVDTGLTLSTAIEDLRTQNPASVRVVTLLLKPDALEHEVPLDFVGFRIPNDFVVGYGLDYDEIGRGLPAIYRLVE